ncbi:MAG: DUF6263 family protein [Fimbriimonadaceae bacterium]
MKLRSLALVAVSLVALTGFKPDDIKLTRTFAVGNKDVYVQTYKSKNSIETPAGNQDFDVTGSSTFSIIYKKTNEKGCEIDMVTSDMKMESAMAMPGVADSMPKEITMSGMLDARNRVSEVKAGKGLDPMVAMMMHSANMGSTGFFTEFPENAVKIGDTWEFSIGMANAGVPADTKLKAKLESEKDNYWVVRVTGTIPMKMDMSQASQQTGGMEMVMNMTMNMDYGVQVEKGTGRALSLTGKIATTMKMEFPSLGMSMPGTGTTEISAKLKQ